MTEKGLLIDVVWLFEALAEGDETVTQGIHVQGKPYRWKVKRIKNGIRVEVIAVSERKF